ncbi:response regulator transcription factor [Eionea flava]
MTINTDVFDVLLVEDHQDIAENIVLFLERNHMIDHAYSAGQARTLLSVNHYDIIILDIMLPDADGFALAREIREDLKKTTPIIFLTARDSLEDKKRGFSLGADDYMTKPFDLEELALRLSALYRRAYGLTNDTIILGKWAVNESSFMITYDEKIVETTKIGFNIFKALVMHHPNIITRKKLEKLLWFDSPPDSDSLRSHIFLLRKAIAKVHYQPVIKTVHGIGFTLQIEKKLCD